MRKLIFLFIFAQIFEIYPNDSFAQENFVLSSNSAALAGANPQVGLTFGGVSIASVALAAAVISSLIAFALEDISASSSTSSTSSTSMTN